jgi:hypothetical protein
MTTYLYLKAHVLTGTELIEFRESLKSLGATLEAKECPEDGTIRLDTPANAPYPTGIRVIATEKTITDVEKLCSDLGFTVSREPPPDVTVQTQWD